jgi:hypothetical protein
MGRQEFKGAVHYSRPACPDTDVRTRRFEPLSQSLGPPRVVESPLRGYNDLQGGFEDVWTLGEETGYGWDKVLGQNLGIYRPHRPHHR